MGIDDYQDAAHEAYRQLLAEQRDCVPESPEEIERRQARERQNAMIRRRLPKVA